MKGVWIDFVYISEWWGSEKQCQAFCLLTTLRYSKNCVRACLPLFLSLLLTSSLLLLYEDRGLTLAPFPHTRAGSRDPCNPHQPLHVLTCVPSSWPTLSNSLHAEPSHSLLKSSLPFPAAAGSLCMRFFDHLLLQHAQS